MLQVAKGRIWTGKQALQHGLVDYLGGLWKALDVAIGLLPMEIQQKHFAAGYKVQYLQKNALSILSLPPMYAQHKTDLSIPDSRQALSNRHHHVDNNNFLPAEYLPFYSLWAIPSIEQQFQSNH